MLCSQIVAPLPSYFEQYFLFAFSVFVRSMRIDKTLICSHNQPDEILTRFFSVKSESKKQKLVKVADKVHIPHEKLLLLRTRWLRRLINSVRVCFRLVSNSVEFIPTFCADGTEIMFYNFILLMKTLMHHAHSKKYRIQSPVSLAPLSLRHKIDAFNARLIFIVRLKINCKLYGGSGPLNISKFANEICYAKQ